MRNKRFAFCVSRFSFLGIILILSGCILDADSEFYPITEQQFLLIGGEPELHLLHIEQGVLNDDWLSQQGWSAEVSDMDAEGDIFWFASGKSKELFRWDATQNKGQVFSFDMFAPHSVVIGDPYLLLIDSVNQQLGFWDPESAEMIIDMPWTYRIGESFYISGKYFVQKGDRHIEVFLERSLQPTAEISFERDILQIQVNASQTLYVLTQDSLVYQHPISYFSYTPTLTPSLLGSYDRIQVTPYPRAQYGKEWLSHIWERDQALFSRRPDFRITNAVESFAVDFFEGKILYQRNDSLLSYNLHEQQDRYIAPLALPIQKYRAFRQPAGQ